MSDLMFDGGYAIDCDALPFIPNGWSYHEEDQLPNRVKGIFTWDPTRVKLRLSKKQRGSRLVVGNNLRRELKSQPILPANALDYLLAHPKLVPDDWKGKAVFFWGTIYRDSDGDPCVRCLYWSGGRWRANYGWLGYDFGPNDPALARAS